MAEYLPQSGMYFVKNGEPGFLANHPAISPEGLARRKEMEERAAIIAKENLINPNPKGLPTRDPITLELLEAEKRINANNEALGIKRKVRLISDTTFKQPQSAISDTTTPTVNSAPMVSPGAPEPFSREMFDKVATPEAKKMLQAADKAFVRRKTRSQMEKDKAVAFEGLVNELKRRFNSKNKV